MSWFTANADAMQTKELKTGMNLASPAHRVEWAVSDGEPKPRYARCDDSFEGGRVCKTVLMPKTKTLFSG